MRTDIRRIAFAYLRLSNEEAAEGESSSIKNQRMIIQDYCERNEILMVRVFVDDGWSGGNFDRPAFQRMLEDVKRKKINCIIVKDLSRLGRNYIETGRYLEKIFPFMGVRFIAITDHYDSATGSDDADQIIVLDEGNMAGIGTHRELMKNCEVYRQIAMSQLSEEELA